MCLKLTQFDIVFMQTIIKLTNNLFLFALDKFSFMDTISVKLKYKEEFMEANYRLTNYDNKYYLASLEMGKNNIREYIDN